MQQRAAPPQATCRCCRVLWSELEEEIRSLSPAAHHVLVAAHRGREPIKPFVGHVHSSDDIVRLFVDLPLDVGSAQALLLRTRYSRATSSSFSGNINRG